MSKARSAILTTICLCLLYVADETQGANRIEELQNVVGTTRQGQFPYFAHISSIQLGSYRVYWQSAVLVSDQHLLIKAEFIRNCTTMQVVLGAQYPIFDELGQQHITIRQEHITYPPLMVMPHDLAIITLPSKVILTEVVRPALLPRRSDRGKNYIGQTAILTTWVKVHANIQVGVFAKVKIGHWTRCVLPADSKLLCVPISLQHTQGGAPLVVKTDEGFEVVGIHTYISTCPGDIEAGDEFWETTDVFVKINEQLDFIAQHTGIEIRP